MKLKQTLYVVTSLFIAMLIFGWGVIVGSEAVVGAGVGYAAATVVYGLVGVVVFVLHRAKAGII